MPQATGHKPKRKATMAKTFADFQQAVDRRVQDAAAKLPPDARDDCIHEVLVGRYSKVHPLKKVVDQPGDGTTHKWTLNTTNSPGWVDNFSVVTALEYPAGERDPVLLDKDEWITYWPDSTAEELRLLRITPISGKSLRVTYTALHSNDGSTVPDGDFEGAANLAAACAAWRLAAIYSQLGDSALGADAVDYRGKVSAYADLARALEERFKELFGMDKEEEQPAASAIEDWPVRLEEGGRRLTH